MNNNKGTLRDEYSEDLIKSGVRGKYAKGTNVILLDSDVMEVFPSSDSVNAALRSLIKQQKDN
jgi:uncharacterized protein (DUF4415 family)